MYKDWRILTLQYLGIDSECVEDEQVATEKTKTLAFATHRKQNMISVRKVLKALEEFLARLKICLLIF